MRLPRYIYPLSTVVSLLSYLSFVNAQITVIETITVRSNSTVTVTRQSLADVTSCGAAALPLCKDIITLFSPSFPFASNTTSPASSTELSSVVETSTSTLGVETPTGTPIGFLITATIAGDDDYYFSFNTGLEGDVGVGLVPRTWGGNATRWFLYNGYLRDHNPPFYKFLWLDPDLTSSTLKKKRDNGAVVVYNLNRSYDYDRATENPLDSLRSVSSGYSVRNSIDTTLLLRSDGVSYSFAAVEEGGVYNVIGVQSDDIGVLEERYIPITLKAAIKALPTSSTVISPKTTGTKTSTSVTTTTDIDSISSISGYAGSATDDGVMYIQTSPINLGTPAPVYLKPISPFGGIVNSSSLDTIKPDVQAKMFYGAKGQDGGMILGNLNVTFPYRSVYLDHSGFVVGIVCNGNNSMTVTWESSDRGKGAWMFARETWETPVLLISAGSSCPRFSNDTESFLIAEDLQFLEVSGGLTTTTTTTVATGTFQPLEELIESLSLDVGPASSGVPFDYVPDIGTPNSGDTGLKFVNIGRDFNQRLNQEIGFFDVSTDGGVAAVMEALYPMPSIGTTTRTMRMENMRMRRRMGNSKRGFLSGLADALARTALAIAEALAKAAIELLAKVFGDQDGAIAWKTFFTPDSIGRDSLNQRTSTACSSYIRKIGPWGCQVRLWMFLPKTVTTAYAQMSDQISKWGNQLVGQTTYATPGIEVYCVDCYVDLALDVKYSLRSNSTGITEAYAFVKGNMTLQLQIGMNAYWEYVWNGTTKLTTIGLGPINIGKLFQFGPYVDVQFQNDVKLALVGQLLLGFSARWPTVDGRVDFVSVDKGDNYMSGLTSPAVTKILQVYGSVTITWTIGLPVAIAFGVKVDAGKVFQWEKDVRFSVTPRVVVAVTFMESGAVSGRLRRDVDVDVDVFGFDGGGGDKGLMVRPPTDVEVFERQDSSEQYCVGALVSAYTQVIFEFIFGDIATLPLFIWPAASNPFYLFTPTCLGRWVDVPMCQKSAVASLKADSNREIFCSGIYGWTSKTTTSTVITREVKTTSGVAMGSTTETVNVLGRLTATHRVYTLTITGYATSRVSAGCTGAASAETLASRAVVTSAPVPVPVSVGMDVVERAGISTPSYFKGWNVASLSSACGCLLIAPPGTKVIYETSTTPGGTSTSFSTQWITTSTTITTSNITVETVTRTGATAIYTTLPAALTQSFPAAQYSLASYTATATADASYTILFKNYNFEINGEDLASCPCGGSGLTCNWIDPVRTNPSYDMTSTCSNLNDCNTICTNINYLYGATNLCVGTVFYPPPRNLCVFKHKLQGLSNITDNADLVDGCGVEKEVAGVKVESGVVDFTTVGWLEWRYEYGYTQLAVDYLGDPLTFHRMLEGSGVDYLWYMDDGSTIGLNWNYTIYVT
ncbi:hypothetical protein AOL_s00169g63 [Orbilia oligospora ATCC 24927]|uniref:Apple domain-containing protein n=1 Tax=Arthrobotrys oligospora (strain ATCC 24927 / CBS 115.81 / DSM 1491) TaxID=756982 RepID=G1XML0_ARTOA|nr:hypothetical protein AOL_s00169g63 [Orbilia oligospora ATCC 24927]EGX45457.1 hypothetical protein AOL_s00169g63 [Orbilia oligospora ATCC 24927]